MTIQDFRAAHPEYADLPDTALADALHAKFYPDLTRDDFRSRFLGAQGSAQARPSGPAKPIAQAASNGGPGAMLGALAGAGEREAAETGKALLGTVTAGLPEMGRTLVRGGKALAEAAGNPVTAAGNVGRDYATATPQGQNQRLADTAMSALSLAGPAAFEAASRVAVPLTRAAGRLGSMIGPLAERLPLRPIASRLTSIDPEIAALLDRTRIQENADAGLAANTLRKAGLGKIAPAEEASARAALTSRGRASTPRAQSVADAFAGIRSAVPPAARAAGVEMGELPDYLPRYAPPPGRAVSGSLRPAMLEQAVTHGFFPDVPSADAALAEWEQGAARQNAPNSILQSMVRQGSAASPDEARAILQTAAGRTRTQPMAQLEQSRTGFPFWNPSLKQTLPAYAQGAARRIAQARNLGPNGEVLGARLAALPPEAQGEAGNLVKLAQGETNDVPNDPMSNLLRTGRQVSSFKLGLTSGLKHFARVPNEWMQSDLPSVLQGIARAATPAGRDVSYEAGAVAPSGLTTGAYHDTGGGGLGSALSKYLGVVFKPQDSAARHIAANAEAAYLPKMAQRALANPESPAGRFALSQLAERQTTPEAIAGSPDALRHAIGHGTSRSQFLLNPLDLPAEFTSTEGGKNLTQFKGYDVQQASLLKHEIADRLAAGIKNKDGPQFVRGLRNLAILGTAYPVLGEGLNDATNGIGNLIAHATGHQGRKRPTGPMRYLNDLLAVSGIGTMAEPAEAILSQEGHQDKTSRALKLMDFLFGPSVGTAVDNAAIAGDALSKRKLTGANGRALVRQIPAVGPWAAPAAFPYKQPPPAP